MIRRFTVCLILLLTLALPMAARAEYVGSHPASDVYVTQTVRHTCTLIATTMMLRNYSCQLGSPYEQVTDTGVGRFAWTKQYGLSQNFTIGQGGGQGGGTLSVGEAASHIGEKGVWVAGYIVGGDLTSAGKTVKTEGITKNTHLALADRSSITDKASCLAVELPAGKVRQALNLVDHPELIGKRVKVKGDLVDKYFGTVGLKSTASYEMP